jgi:Na+/proline symporter
VLRDYLWPGVRGLVIAGLLAAFMSTFSATVNAAASYIVRDLFQPLARVRSESRWTIRASYVATVAVVLVGTLMGMSVTSIGQIWNWIMMELGAAFVIPNVLRWYWWRMNGWGYAAGTLLGLAGAVVVPFLPEGPQMHVTFPSICAVSLAGCLFGTWLTQPTDKAVLIAFYRGVRPFGFWGQIRVQSGLSQEQLHDPAESMWLTVFNVVVASVAIIGVYLGPMYLVGHWYVQGAVWLGGAAAAMVLLYFTWYTNLPPADPASGKLQ